MSAKLSDVFIAPGRSAVTSIVGKANISLERVSDTGTGTVALERRKVGEATWKTVSKDVDGSKAIYALTAGDDIELIIENEEPNVEYSLNCTTAAGAGVACRIGSR